MVEGLTVAEILSDEIFLIFLFSLISKSKNQLIMWETMHMSSKIYNTILDCSA